MATRGPQWRAARAWLSVRAAAGRRAGNEWERRPRRTFTVRRQKVGGPRPGKGGPRATQGGWTRGERTRRRGLVDPLRAPPSHSGCRPRGGRTGHSARSVDRGHLGVREPGLGCLATSQGRVGQEQRSAANFQSVCHCRGGREALLPFLRTLVPRSPQRLSLQGAACWLGGHEYFLKTSMHTTRDPRHSPKDTRVIQNGGRNR